MDLVENISDALYYIYGNTDPSEDVDQHPELGKVDVAAASAIRGQDLGSILDVLRETNSDKGEEISGTDEYKRAYEGVMTANICLQNMRGEVKQGWYDSQNDEYINQLRKSCDAIENYLTAKSKGVFFKHPVTPKGKKRYACMENARKILDVAINHYKLIETENDDKEVDTSGVRANSLMMDYFQKNQIRKLSNDRGLDSVEIAEDLNEVVYFLNERLFEKDKLGTFIYSYKIHAMDVSVKALLMRRGTAASDRALTRVFKLGGSNLGEQLTMAYDLLEKVDAMAEAVYKSVDEVNVVTNKEELVGYKRDILSLIRMLNFDRSVLREDLKRL